VFSPYYAWSGYRDPLDHCALNVALYGPRGRWAMTERRRAAVARDADMLRIGPSAMAWDGSRLTVEVDERGAPLPRRLRGKVVLEPEAWNAREFALSARNAHVWRPIAPFARVQVDFREPELSWSGGAYLDFNSGDAPLQSEFRRWTWSRARLGDGAAIFYEAERRHEPPLQLSLRFGRDGAVREAAAPPKAALPKGWWRVARETRSETDARVTASFEDSPFYTRSAIAHRLDGQDVVSMHESLDLDRFSLNLVRAMLPFRMPRW
jgi:carotenoid 1,2-hydratase